MTGMMHSYDNTPRAVTANSTSRPFQPTSSHMEMNMPLFTSHSLTTSVPYQSGASAFAFDSLVNPYNMQQQFPVTYPTTISHSVTYPVTSPIQSMPTVREARNAFRVDRSSPPVKVETASPVQGNQLYSDGTFGDDFKQKADTAEGGLINFSTDVDTLMKEIQAKEKMKQIQPRVSHPKVRSLSLFV